MPQKTRVQLIAAALLVLAGTEAFVLAPYILDIALLIDVGGLVVIVAALRSSISVSLMQLRAFAATFAKTLFSIYRTGKLMRDFGSEFLPRWYPHYFLVDRICTRASVALLALSIGLQLTKALVG